MADIPVLVEGRFPVRITVAIAVEVGDLLAYDGSNWVLADADTPATKYARLIAGESVDGSVNTTLTGYKEALLYDADAPYTLGDKQYLSGAAGAHTATRPAATKLVQCVGQALSTDTVHLECRDLHEVEVPIITTGATSAYALLDSGDYGGPTLDAQNETLSLFTIVPDGAVSVAKAELFLAAEATGGTPTMDITISSSIDGAQHDVVTPDATLANQAREGAAADEMQVLDISTGLDATDIVRPGAGIGIKCLQDDAGTDISFVFGGRIVWNCV